MSELRAKEGDPEKDVEPVPAANHEKLHGTTWVPVTMVEYNKKLYFASAQANGFPSNIVIHEYQGGTATVLGSWITPMPLSLAVFGKYLFMAFHNLEMRVHVTWTGDPLKSWDYPVKVFPHWATEKATPMAAFNNKLYMTFVGRSSGEPYIVSSSDGETWGAKELFGNWKTSNPMSLVSFNGKLFLSFIGHDKKVYIASSSDGSTWPHEPQLVGMTTERPAWLVAAKGSLWMSIENVGKVYILQSQDGYKWTYVKVLAIDILPFLGYGLGHLRLTYLHKIGMAYPPWLYTINDLLAEENLYAPNQS